jgi:hypothetical protein
MIWKEQIFRAAHCPEQMPGLSVQQLMKMTSLLLAAAPFVAAIFSTTALALTVERAVNPEYLREHPGEFSVTVRKEENGLVVFTVVRTLSEPKYLVAHLSVRQQGRMIAESHTPSFAKGGDNTFHFSLSPEHLGESRFEIAESSARDGVPLPGTVKYQFHIRDFVPEEWLPPSAPIGRY